VRRGIKMFERVNTRILGIVENMGSFVCPHCDEPIDIFESGGGERLASQMGVPFLASIPLDPAVRRAGEEGRPTVLAQPESAAAKALGAVAAKVLETVRENVRTGAARTD
jgi:ATP-binding protein involved in chromosome partitioning